MSPEDELAKSLLVAMRAEFPERDATARQLAEMILDAVAAALPLTRNEAAEAPLRELEALAQQIDVYSWEGAPGWDIVLARGLSERRPLEPGPLVLDGIGAKQERTEQRVELAQRGHAQAQRLIELAREGARLDLDRHAGAVALGEMPTRPAPDALVAVHATLLRLVALGAASSLLFLPEDTRAGTLPPSALEELLREIDQRGEGFTLAQEEWLALLLAKNPAAAAAPAFRTFYAGLSQTLRAPPALLRFRDAAREGLLAEDPEALLAAVASWQPIRWQSLRSGAPSSWLEQLCPPAAEHPTELPLQQLARECSAALEVFSRLWFAHDLSLSGFSSLGALFVARCASILALWEELGGGKIAA